MESSDHDFRQSQLKIQINVISLPAAISALEHGASSATGQAPSSLGKNTGFDKCRQIVNMDPADNARSGAARQTSFPDRRMDSASRTIDCGGAQNQAAPGPGGDPAVPRRRRRRPRSSFGLAGVFFVQPRLDRHKRQSTKYRRFGADSSPRSIASRPDDFPARAEAEWSRQIGDVVAAVPSPTGRGPVRPARSRPPPDRQSRSTSRTAAKTGNAARRAACRASRLPVNPKPKIMIKLNRRQASA